MIGSIYNIFSNNLFFNYFNRWFTFFFGFLMKNLRNNWQLLIIAIALIFVLIVCIINPICDFKNVMMATISVVALIYIVYNWENVDETV